MERVHIHRPLGEEPRRLVPKDINLLGTVVDPLMRPKGGILRLPCPVVSYIGREECFGRAEQSGYTYKDVPHKYWTKKILVPWLQNFMVVAGRPVLNMILFRADNVARAVHHYKDGLIGPAELQVSVNRYFDEVADMLMGKNGLMTRDLYGVRCTNSIRAVAVPEPKLLYTQAGIPRTLARKAHIEQGDWVLVTRSPVLWQGSILAMQAKLIDGIAIQMPPPVNPGYGLDFDGDQMSAFRVSTALDPGLSVDMLRAVGDPTNDFQWYDEFLLNNPDTTPSWTNIDFDVGVRLNPTGLSVNLQDAMDPQNSEFFQTICRSASVPEDTAEYAAGMPRDKWIQQVGQAAIQVTRLKLEIGLLGSATDKLNQILLQFAPQHLRVGMQLKERLTELMMKTAKRGGLEDTIYTTERITSLLDMRNWFQECAPEVAHGYLVRLGFTDPAFRDIVELIWQMGGVTNALREHMPLQQACRTKDRAAMVRVLRGKREQSSIAARVHNYGGEQYEDSRPLPDQRVQSQ